MIYEEPEREEIQICEIDKRRTRINPEIETLIPKDKRADLVFIISECVNNVQPAWYYREFHKNRPRVKLMLPVQQPDIITSLEESYVSKAEEDLELAIEFSWTREKRI